MTSVQVLGCSESMTSQNRNLVIRMVQEHLSLEVTKTPRPNEGLPGPAFDPMTYRTKCILGGLSEGNTAIWQDKYHSGKGKLGVPRRIEVKRKVDLGQDEHLPARSDDL